MIETNESVQQDVESGAASGSLQDGLTRYEELRSAARNTRRIDPQDSGLDEALVLECEGELASAASDCFKRLPTEIQLKLHALYMAAVRLDSIQERRQRHGEDSGLFQATKDSENEIERTISSMSTTLTAAVRPLVPAFAWWMVWWADARKDAVSFVFNPGADAFLVAMLGRPPSSHQSLSRSFYDRAADADRNCDARLRILGGEARLARGERGHL